MKNINRASNFILYTHTKELLRNLFEMRLWVLGPLDPPKIFLLKPLRKLWRQSKHPHTKYNALIVDDSPYNYHQNYGNGIPIGRWNYINSQDEELLMLVKFLDYLQQCHRVKVNIRGIVKRRWKEDVKEIKDKPF